MSAAILFLAFLFAPAPETLEITVLGDARDPRSAAIREAVDYWNDRLAAVGAGVRFGNITFSDERIPDDVLRAISGNVMEGRGSRSMWSWIRPISGDVVIALSDTDLVSTGFDWEPGGKGLVVLRRGDTEPLSLPNVARNAVAHELGHVLGLPHDSDPGSLMCGRPAPCRPDTFRSDTPRFFPLTAEAERQLREIWPQLAASGNS